MTSPFVEKAKGYARKVVAGKIPAGTKVVLACKRFLADLARAAEKSSEFPYHFSPAAAHRFGSFAALMPHIKGQWAARGETIVLTPWMCFVGCNLFGWLHRETGLRRFRFAYVEVPRKNAKSTFAAIVANYMLCEDGEASPEVYIGATSQDQAREVFEPARQMLLRAPGCATHYGLEIRKKAVLIKGAPYGMIPIIGKPGDGASPHCAIHDEYHEHLTSEQLDTMQTGMGARTQPLQLVITTAGTDTAAPCYEMHEEMTRLLQGAYTDERAFAVIYDLEADEDWQSLDAWRKANPNFGISVDGEFLSAQLDKAKRSARDQSTIKCKHLNLWSGAASQFFNMMRWGECKRPGLAWPDPDEGWRLVVGMDMAKRVDIASVIFLFGRLGAAGLLEYRAFGRHYLPEETALQPENKHLEAWGRTGHLTLTDGGEIDFRRIETDLAGLDDGGDGLLQEGRAEELVYDPVYGTDLTQRLAARHECERIEFPAGRSMLTSPAMFEIEAAIATGRLLHDGDPVLAWMMSNVVAVTDRRGNVYPRKTAAKHKIDGAFALIMAASRFASSEPAEDLSEVILARGGLA